MPTPERPKLVESEMDFYDALRLVAIGKKITRKEWASEACVFLHAGVVHLRKADATLHVLLVGDGDLVATDWIVVREQ